MASQHDNRSTEGAQSLPPGLPREYLNERRRALLTELQAIERALGVPPSVPSKSTRERLYFEQRRGGGGE